MNQLPDSLTMGAVSLRVADVDLALSFYSAALGLEIISTLQSGYVLGSSKTSSLILEHHPELKHASSGSAGLFHSAFLFQNQSDLAFAVASIASRFPGSFTGSADHLVSQAFYFDDPEGNGVELYWDRPRSEWQVVNGRIQMDTLALNPNAFLKEHLVTSEIGPSEIGHVHLSVGTIEQARNFYVDLLGFDLTFEFGNSALFVSAGGYHHHMAMNIWRSRGAGRRQQALGLGDVALHLGSEDAVLALTDRAKFQNWATAYEQGALLLDDPWGNRVTVRA